MSRRHRNGRQCATLTDKTDTAFVIAAKLLRKRIQPRLSIYSIIWSGCYVCWNRIIIRMRWIDRLLYNYFWHSTLSSSRSILMNMMIVTYCWTARSTTINKFSTIKQCVRPFCHFFDEMAYSAWCHLTFLLASEVFYVMTMTDSFNSQKKGFRFLCSYSMLLLDRIWPLIDLNTYVQHTLDQSTIQFISFVSLAFAWSLHLDGIGMGRATWST